jgi:3-dehydroquinate dehydratase/shikimate dehydrogenase
MIFDMTYLAVPIAAKDLEGARSQMRFAAGAGAEMLELRTDYFENLNVLLVRRAVEAARETGLPVIVTCRDVREGGARDYETRLRAEVLAGALKAGAQFVDFEYANFAETLHREKILAALAGNSKARLILSAHDFKGRFEDIGRIYRQIAGAYPAAIPKLVYTARHINDCFEAFDLLNSTSGERAVLCMGEAGLISRILAKKLGGFVTFASVDQPTATAPGQMTIEQFKGLYRYESIDEKTEVYGVIGSPIGHSLSPAIHNACFAGAGMNRVYLPLHVEGGAAEFERFMDGVLRRDRLGFRGLSVTIPHKGHALEFVRRRGGAVEPLAERIGAVNTVIAGRDGRVSGYNTDYAGALGAIVDGLGLERAGLAGMSVAVLGAGGAARAIVVGLCDAGAKVLIYNRTVEKAKKLAEEFGCAYAGLDELKGPAARLVVNCTSVGMYPHIHETPLPKELITSGMAVFDTVYNPPETLLLKQAKDAGAKTISGMEMFINQAAEQFKLFTHSECNMSVLRKTVLDSLTF